MRVSVWCFEQCDLDLLAPLGQGDSGYGKAGQSAVPELQGLLTSLEPLFWVVERILSAVQEDAKLYRCRFFACNNTRNAGL